jgi:hypothetical protein
MVTAKQYIIKIRYNIVIFKHPVMQNHTSQYFPRYIKQPHNNSQELLFLILVKVIMNCGGKSIKRPKRKTQMQIVFDNLP